MKIEFPHSEEGHQILITTHGEDSPLCFMVPILEYYYTEGDKLYRLLPLILTVSVVTLQGEEVALKIERPHLPSTLALTVSPSGLAAVSAELTTIHGPPKNLITYQDTLQTHRPLQWTRVQYGELLFAKGVSMRFPWRSTYQTPDGDGRYTFTLKTVEAEEYLDFHSSSYSNRIGSIYSTVNIKKFDL